MGVTAENVAAEYGVSRAEQDALPVESHRLRGPRRAGRLLRRADHSGAGADQIRKIAPTNFLPTNRAAVKRAFETGGLWGARGLPVL